MKKLVTYFDNYLFGNKLKELRIAKKMSQEALAAKITEELYKIDQGTISNYEMGKTIPSADVFFFLCSYLEIDFNEFIHNRKQNTVDTTSKFCGEMYEICKGLDTSRKNDLLQIAKMYQERARDGTTTESPRRKRATRVGVGD